MRTIGIDLAAQPRNTACCVIDWESPRASVTLLQAGFDDAALVELVRAHRPEKVAVDSPFGWPLEFTRAIARFTESGEWPDAEDRLPLLFRATDLVVRERTRTAPLSVSSNLLGICAMRCARLQTLLAGGAPLDRTGAGLLAEVYPAAALRQWELDPRGYKGAKPERLENRRRLVAQIVSATHAWLDLDGETAAKLESSDHLLDALVSAVVGRALVVGATLPIPAEHLAAARAEGWIHLPRRRALAEVRLSG